MCIKVIASHTKNGTFFETAYTPVSMYNDVVQYIQPNKDFA